MPKITNQTILNNTISISSYSKETKCNLQKIKDPDGTVPYQQQSWAWKLNTALLSEMKRGFHNLCSRKICTRQVLATRHGITAVHTLLELVFDPSKPDANSQRILREWKRYLQFHIIFGNNLVIQGIIVPADGNCGLFHSCNILAVDTS